MGDDDEKNVLCSLHLIFLYFILFISSSPSIAKEHGSSSSPSMEKFTPADNYLINCGSQETTLLDDGRTFKSDPESASFLSTDKNILTSIDSIPPNIISSSSLSSSSSSFPLFLTARIFQDESMYRFLIFKPGRHWLRLYFYPLPHPIYNLASTVFTVTTDSTVLLHRFSVKKNTTMVFKEYLINITSYGFSLKFSPMKNSYAFINCIELVSAPDDLIPDSASAVSPAGNLKGVSKYAIEVCYRLNVGGPMITPRNDTLGRTWLPDTQFMKFPQGAKNVSVSPQVIEYPKGRRPTPLAAPNWVYATGDSMADSGVVNSNFNLTWVMTVDPTFSYLIRLHFCDIVSKGLNELYFNVYLNGMLGVSGLDLSTLTAGLAVPYYKDFVLDTSSISNSSIMVQIGPSSDLLTLPNAILNGLEVMKMSNMEGSLDGLFGEHREPKSGPSTTQIAATIALAVGVTAILLVALGLAWWTRKPKEWKKRKRRSFSSWLIPLNSNSSSQYCSFLSSKSKSKSSSSYSSSMSSSGIGLGRFFTLHELREATRNFDERAVIGVGGFGKVYLGELEDGTKVAIKRGNPSSAQGVNEFQTEIHMLSKVRHRHLVSLIGYCDQQSEMILVYEYMSNGPFRDHLYGSSSSSEYSTKAPLSWRQRLEICIGAARGLHYLHTGAAEGIIHRDVKTTNILLDENFVAKVSDFGLSKAAPSSLEQTHVSTAVKGSFGYLDPEYFRRQQLTEKSDVYSFGVVLLEVLCGRAALDPRLPRERVNLAEWAMNEHRKGSIQNIIDPCVVGSISSWESVMKYVEAAEKCLADCGVERPSMGDVLWNLEFALQLQEASSKLDPPEEEEEDDEVLFGVKPLRKKKDNEGELSIAISDDSGVVVGSPLLSPDFQGR